MRWQPTTAFVALVAVGAGAGFYAAQAADVPSSTDGPAAPAPAASPRWPVPTGDDLTKDPPQPALEAGLELVPTSFGTSPTRLSFPVPAGWRRLTNAPNEFRWKVPGHPEDTYVLRVEQVASQRRTVADHRAERIRSALAGEHGVRILDTSNDGLEYTYIDDLGHRRHLFVRWLDLTGNPLAEAEVNLSGRDRDAAGAAELVRRVAGGMRQD